MLVIVTNLNARTTGVSTTAAAVLRAHVAAGLDVKLAGYKLDGCPAPISIAQARRLSRQAAESGKRVIWHVRRNQEMRAAIITRDLLRVPISVVFTSAAKRRHSWFPRQLINRMDAVIATSDEAAALVPHVERTIAHGVDTARFTPVPDRAAAWQALGYGGTCGIATVGRIRPEKGTDIFVDMMIGALPHLAGAKALIVGRAAPAHQGFVTTLKTKIAAAGLSERIVFAGEIAPSAMPALMGGLSLLVQVPRYEGYGMTVLEAMACGTPFIATDTGAFCQFAAASPADGCRVLTLDAPHATPNDVATLCAASDDVQAQLRQAAESHSVAREAEAIADVYRQISRAPL